MRRFVLLLLLAIPAVAQEITVSDPTFEEQPVGRAAVTAAGDRFITAWERPDNGGIYFSLTDVNGTLLRGPVTVSLTGGHPHIAAAGTNGSLIAWLDENVVYTAMIDKDGNVGARRPLPNRGMRLDPSSIVWNGNRFLVLTRITPAGVAAFLIDANGEYIDGPIGISDWTAVATADDNGFLIFATVAVDQTHPEKGFTIQARRIESEGALSEFTPTTTEVVTFTLPNLAAVHRTLYWQSGNVLHRVVTDANGAPVSEVTSMDPYQLQKAIETPAGTLLFLLESEPRSWLELMDSNGKLVTRRDIPFSADVAAIGTRALFVTSSPLRGYFASLGSTIQVSDAINVGRMATDQLSPQVASNGTLLLATWIEPASSQLFAARIADSKHLDRRGILIDSQVYVGQTPAVAALGDGFVIAYLEVSSGVAHLWIRRVFPDGTLDAARTLVSTTAQPFAPVFASDGNQALLVWTENTYNVRGTRISRDGAVMDPTFLRISDGDTHLLQFEPDVGIDGDSYLVAWQGQKGVPFISLEAVHVTKSGVILDPPSSLPMNYRARVAADTVLGTNGANVLVDTLGQLPIDLGMRGFGDIETFRGGLLTMGPDPSGLWAAEMSDGKIENRFTIALPAAASQPELTKTQSGVAVTYLRRAGNEGYGGSRRAYVLPLSEQRRRPASSAR